MFTTTIKPRFTDCDGLGHISHTALPVWFEEARTPLFHIFNPSLSLETWNLILKRIDIELHEQIWHGTDIIIETELEQLGNSSLIVIQRAYQDGRYVADGRTVLIHFDYEKQKPAAIPPAIREKLREHLAEQ
jgi:acyl-CoA thioester hydrolase